MGKSLVMKISGYKMSDYKMSFLKLGCLYKEMPAGGRGLMQAFFMLRGNIMVEKRRLRGRRTAAKKGFIC